MKQLHKDKNMNRISRYIIAALGAVVTLVSCTKEPALVPEDGGLLPQEQTRKIAVSFGVSTKTTLDTDGITPIFEAGDVIKVSNATLSEDCTVKNIGGSLKIITRLSGTLTAVYPSTAANMSGNGNAPIKASPDLPYKVSSTQSGLFKDANICTASISEGSTSATFNNVTPLLKFYVDESIGVQSLTIISTENIASDGDGKTITVAPAGGALIHTVTTGNPDPRLCYIAILPNVNANTITYTSETTVQGQGTVTSTMTSDKTLAANHIYKAFIPYYIKVQVGTDDYQKWAYCNVGAFLPEDYGRYFAWGDVVGQTWNGSAWSGSGFETMPSIGNPNVLPLVNDAAYVNWDAHWRTPTSYEFQTLFNAHNTIVPTSGGTESTVTQGVYWCESYYGKKGILFCDGTNKLFFPLGGVGQHQTLNNSTDRGMYLTSSRYSGDGLSFYRLNFSDTFVQVFIQSNRKDGFSVRAIYDDFKADGSLSDYNAEEFGGVPQVDPLSEEFSVSATRKVKFSPANLRYTVDTKQWSFFEHQYDCGASTYTGYHDKEISLFTWGKGWWSIISNTGGYYEPEEDIQGTVYDWGTGKWRTLTYPEWKYLLYSRKITDDKVGFARARVNGMKGIVIFPDGYSGSTSGTGISSYNDDFPSSDIPSETWTAMETDGVVFLPAAGSRNSNTYINYVNQKVRYWTASYYPDTNDTSYCIIVEEGEFDNNGEKYGRGMGLSVRLVTDVTE